MQITLAGLGALALARRTRSGGRLRPRLARITLVGPEGRILPHAFAPAGWLWI